jgi:1-acyl-sn-glycerol-3-phosphate acyltransferase
VSTIYWLRTVFLLVPTIALYTTVAGSAALLSNLWDRTGRFTHSCARAWSYCILVTTRVRVDVRGLNRLVPGATYVFVANHQSLYDIPVLFWWLPYQLRIIAKESIGRIPFMGWPLRRAGHLLVDRSNPDREWILSRWRALIGQGLSLIIFPEGTRSPDGSVGRFKAGSFLLAIEAGLPVVPITVSGTRAVMRKGHFTVRPGDVTLTIHEPIRTDAGDLKPLVADARLLAARAQEIIAATADIDAGVNGS